MVAGTGPVGTVVFVLSAQPDSCDTMVQNWRYTPYQYTDSHLQTQPTAAQQTLVQLLAYHERESAG